jgi:carboxylesterase
MTTADANDRSTFHQGGRTGFLLIHGLAGTPVELRYVAQGLARAGYTAYCCQLAGHCASYESLQYSTWQDWYRSIEEAHDRLAACCDVIIAGGLSTGALLALHLARDRPALVQGLALYAPSLRLDGWAMPWYKHLLHLIRPTSLPIEMNLADREPYGLKDERIRRLVVESMMNGDPTQHGHWGTPLRTLANFNSLAALVRRELREITAPALIVHPRDDDMASIKNAFRIQAGLGGLAELVVLDDSYHIITLDRQRQIVVDRTVAFAERIVQQHVRARPAAVRLHHRRSD